MKLVLIPIALALSGCATTEYADYAKAQGDIARANAEVQSARYNALSKVAETGTESAKIAAVMALALGGSSQATAVQQVQAPQPSQALQWAQVLVPSITNIASLHYTSRASMAASESAARVSESTNAAFVGLASKIQAPVTVVPQAITPIVAAPVLPQANVTTTTTSTDNHAVSNTTSAATTSTLSGTGVLGSGSYSTVSTPAPVVITPVVTNPVITTPPVVITPVTVPQVITPVVQIVPVAPK